MVENIGDETQAKTPEGDEQKKPATDSGKGVQPETTNLIDNAHEAAKELKAENDRREKLLAEEKELEARKALGGGSEAGQPAEKPVKTKEEVAKDYIKEKFENLR